jgi:hypothetical protein
MTMKSWLAIPILLVKKKRSATMEAEKEAGNGAR